MATCEFCEKQFKGRNRKNRKTGQSRFCSVNCYWKNMTIMLNCKTCGIEFKRTSNGVLKYCSFKCQTIGDWGEKIRTMNIGKKHTKETIEKRMKSIVKRFAKKQPTSIEKIVYDYLLLKGILFEKQKLVGSRYVVDAYIPSLNLVIEADGEYWHSRQDNIERDKRKNKYLKEKGYTVIRLSEKEINNGKFIERLVV